MSTIQSTNVSLNKKERRRVMLMGNQSPIKMEQIIMGVDVSTPYVKKPESEPLEVAEQKLEIPEKEPLQIAKQPEDVPLEVVKEPAKEPELDPLEAAKEPEQPESKPLDVEKTPYGLHEFRKGE
jgi:hypothetical protein